MNPLDQLKDIHLPAEVSPWPLSWTWWLMLLAIVCLIAAAVFAYRSYQKRTRIKRQALKELMLLQQNSCDLTTLHQLLKRVALSCFPRQEVASLQGADWLLFLDQQVKKNKTGLFSNDANFWLDNLYQAGGALLATEAHFDTCRSWLKNADLQPKEPKDV